MSRYLDICCIDTNITFYLDLYLDGFPSFANLTGSIFAPNVLDNRNHNHRSAYLNSNLILR